MKTLFLTLIPPPHPFCYMSHVVIDSQFESKPKFSKFFNLGGFLKGNSG